VFPAGFSQLFENYVFDLSRFHKGSKAADLFGFLHSYSRQSNQG
jgi:hypothetical protein